MVNSLASRSILADGISKAFDGTPVLDGVHLHVGAGSTVALLGPSGCGKTTLLRIISGLEVPDGGEVRLGDRLLTGPSVLVAPERRRIGMVFQDWALFPHLDVARNVGYGLPRQVRRNGRVERALDMVGLADFATRMPATLSGGQQQRVALARALAPEPDAILLDEPFSNLDTTLRNDVRGEVRELLIDLDMTAVFVTHDQDEAFVLGDEVAVMSEGRVVQQATPAELYARPVSRWVASFVGESNLLAMEARGRVATCAVGPVPLAGAVDGAGQVLLRPEDLVVVEGDDAGVDHVEYYGHDCRYTVRLDSGEVVYVRAMSTPRFGRGQRVALRYGGGPTVAFVD
jgi:iron(III) transport system ATP-binding protein